MKSIFLTGFMGSGKSSIAVVLAELLALPVKDTDAEIEKQYGRSIPDIFEEEGESGFRYYETEVLKKMPEKDTVIATGGGIVERETNRKWMKQHGIVVYLSTSFPEISRRLQEDTERPLWRKKDKERLYQQRLPLYYSTASIIIETDGETPEAIARALLTQIKASGQL